MKTIESYFFEKQDAESYFSGGGGVGGKGAKPIFQLRAHISLRNKMLTHFLRCKISACISFRGQDAGPYFFTVRDIGPYSCELQCTIPLCLRQFSLSVHDYY